MGIKNYDELTSMELDTLREIGSMGTGNAATALSQMLGRGITRPSSGSAARRRSPPGYW